MCHINLRVEDSPQVFGFVLELGIALIIVSNYRQSR